MIRKTRQQIFSFIIILVLMLSLISCTNKSKLYEIEEESMTIPTDQVGTQTEMNDLNHQEDKSAVLKLYLQNRNSYNPLNAFDYSGRAAFQLLNRSLFKIDSENILTNDLVETSNYVNEKNSYEILLLAGATFDDQELITAEDCKASILAYHDYLETYLNTQEIPNNTEQAQAEIIVEDDQEDEKDPLSQYVLERSSDEKIDINLLRHQYQLLNQITGIEVIDERRLEVQLITDDNSFEQTETESTSKISEVIENDVLDEENNEKLEDEDTNLQENLPVNNPDRGILFALTMPILKQEYVDRHDFQTYSSGKYHLKEITEEGILLEANNADKSLQNILLVQYKDSKKAVRALEDNQLDMVYLDENNFNLFGKQNARKIISFPGQRYYYLQFGNNSKIKDNEFANHLKAAWYIRDDLTQTMVGHQTIMHLPLQYHDAAISKFNLFNVQVNRENPFQYFNNYANNKISLELIVPNTVKEQEWGIILREKLLTFNIDLKINIIDKENYLQSIAEGEYDLALNWVDLNYPMAVLDTYRSISDEAFSNLNTDEIILSNYLYQYFNSVSRQLDDKIIEDNLPIFQDFIVSNFKELNILGIGFSEVGILMSNYVENVPNSTINNPYFELEDLWVRH